jgi:hypothetical protein
MWKFHITLSAQERTEEKENVPEREIKWTEGQNSTCLLSTITASPQESDAVAVHPLSA